jgi:hypothetical protein
MNLGMCSFLGPRADSVVCARRDSLPSRGPSLAAAPQHPGTAFVLQPGLPHTPMGSLVLTEPHQTSVPIVPTSPSLGDSYGTISSQVSPVSNREGVHPSAGCSPHTSPSQLAAPSGAGSHGMTHAGRLALGQALVTGPKECFTPILSMRLGPQSPPLIDKEMEAQRDHIPARHFPKLPPAGTTVLPHGFLCLVVSNAMSVRFRMEPGLSHS